jgi:ArsR family transcriptional regulator, arsenate/arsenite/antimonite-responsive transcriptional repressor
MSKQTELSVLCCSPMTSEPLPAEEADKLARMFKALGDPIRLRLLSLITATRGVRHVCAS